MIDYLAVMLVAVGSALALLAFYLYFAPDESHRPGWGSAFLGIGLLLTLLSVPLNVMWPLTGSYNIAFGEPALFFGLTLDAAGLALLMKQEVLAPAILGFFGGIVAIIVGFTMISMGMTKEPGLAGTGYILAGLGGVLTLPAVGYRKQRVIAIVAAIVLLVGALIWLYTGYMAYPGHLAGFAKWVPPALANAHH